MKPLVLALAVVAAGLAGLAPATARAQEGEPAASAQEGERIVEIEIVDNKKTDDSTVLLMADVAVGDRYTSELAKRIRSDLVTSYLFKDVQVFATPAEGGVKLTIAAREKQSWIVGPTFYNQPGNVGGGLGYGEANLFGQNRKLVLYGQIATADSLFFAVYLDPAIGASRYFWRIDTYLRHVKMTEYEQPTESAGQPEAVRVSDETYLNAGVLVGANLVRGVSLDARLRGAYVYFRDPAWAEDCARPECQSGAEPEVPQADGSDVSFELRLLFDRRANWHGVTRGTMFRVMAERTIPGLSDADWWLVSGQYSWARRFFEEHNLVLKTGAGIGGHLPFQQEYTSGGAPGLRGYKSWQFRGDTKANATLEYSVPIFKAGPFAFRALGFWDSAFTTWTMNDDNHERSYLAGQVGEPPRRAEWRNGVGGGFRVYVKSVVLPLVGMDVGYGLEANDYHLYFALGLVEL